MVVVEAEAGAEVGVGVVDSVGAMRDRRTLLLRSVK